MFDNEDFFNEEQPSVSEWKKLKELANKQIHDVFCTFITFFEDNRFQPFENAMELVSIDLITNSYLDSDLYIGNCVLTRAFEEWIDLQDLEKNAQDIIYLQLQFHKITNLVNELNTQQQLDEYSLSLSTVGDLLEQINQLLIMFNSLYYTYNKSNLLKTILFSYREIALQELTLLKDL